MSNFHFFPKKSLGQVFLKKRSVLQKIIKEGEIEENDIVLEIGAGLGNLTMELERKVKIVFAIEKDAKVVNVLREKFKNSKKVKIIEGDAREILPKISENLKGYKIVANIPYYLTSFLFRQIFELKNKPKLMVLLVQKEVAERVVAKPPKSTFLGMMISFFAEAKIVGFVSKNCFWPKPKVDSAILKLTLKEKEEEKEILKLIKMGFTFPRKKLANNLATGLKLKKECVENLLKSCKIKVDARAENLTLKDWKCLFEKLKNEKKI